jgi:hypothetical protein
MTALHAHKTPYLGTSTCPLGGYGGIGFAYASTDVKYYYNNNMRYEDDI